MMREVEVAIVVALVTKEGLGLKSFSSNSEAKSTTEMEDIENVLKETIGSMVKEIKLEGEWDTAMGIVEYYIHYSTYLKKNIETYLVIVVSKTS